MYEAICKNNILLFSLTLIHSISTYLFCNLADTHINKFSE